MFRQAGRGAAGWPGKKRGRRIRVGARDFDPWQFERGVEQAQNAPVVLVHYEFAPDDAITYDQFLACLCVSGGPRSPFRDCSGIVPVFLEDGLAEARDDLPTTLGEMMSLGVEPDLGLDFAQDDLQMVPKTFTHELGNQ